MSLLQPMWPLRKDHNHGPYKSFEREEVARSLHQDLLFLLRTIPGEWPMRPSLGVGLTKYLFETENSQELLSVVSRIRQQVKMFLPSIQVLDIKINTDPELVDINQAHITINYYVSRLNLEGSINVDANSLDGSNDQIKIQQNSVIQSAINRGY